jgi:hypothetical protein
MFQKLKLQGLSRMFDFFWWYSALLNAQFQAAKMSGGMTVRHRASTLPREPQFGGLRPAFPGYLRIMEPDRDWILFL